MYMHTYMLIIFECLDGVFSLELWAFIGEGLHWLYTFQMCNFADYIGPLHGTLLLLPFAAHLLRILLDFFCNRVKFLDFY